MTAEQPPATEAVPTPRCYRHPDRETWVSCTRCERPICPDCLRPASVGFQCPQCVAEGQSGTRQPRTAYGGRVARRVGVVSAVLGGVSVVLFLVTAATSAGGFTRNDLSPLFGRLSLVGAAVAVDHEYWRLVTSAFLHFGAFHLLANMIALGMLGPGLERVFGAWRYLAVYLLGALGGGVSVYLFDSPFGAVVGASGAIFGLFAATLVVVRQLGLDPRALLVVLGINFAISFRPGISLFGHLGGFVVGGLAALGMVYAPRAGRTQVQAAVVVGLLAVLVGLVVYRTSALVG